MMVGKQGETTDVGDGRKSVPMSVLGPPNGRGPDRRSSCNI